MRICNLSLSLLLAVSGASFADTFQFEVGGDFSSRDTDYGFMTVSDDVANIWGQFYFDQVETGGSAFLEAPFLQRSSKVLINHKRVNYDNGNTAVSLAKVDWYIPDTIFYVAPLYVNISADDDVYGDDSSENSIGMSIGFTPVEGMLIKTTWFEDFDYSDNLSFKYVAEFGAGQALNMELDYEKSDEEYLDDYWGIAFDFYFDPTWSGGVYFKSQTSLNDIAMGSGWIVGKDTIGIRSTKFFTDQISLQASYAVSDTIDSWSLGVSYRF